MYLDPKSNAILNLNLMANNSAYTTATEEKAANAVLADHYGMKKGFALTASILLIALAIILGVVVHPAAAAVSAGIIVPVGVWLSFRPKHQDLEKMHDIEYNKCVDVIITITKYLQDLRDNKIDLLLKVSLNSPSLKMALETAESNYDQKNSYLNVAAWAKNAKELVKRIIRLHDLSYSVLIVY